MRVWPLLLLLLSGDALAQGGPYGYTVMGPLQKLPNAGRPRIEVAFPEIRDWTTLKITLSRSPCFGSCPAYAVEIDGDGTVRYDGQSFVAVTGKHQAKITPDAVRALYVAFRQAKFYWLYDKYAANITDNPTYEIGISFDGGSKTVTDYVGPAVGMPKEARELEAKIDAAGETEKWVAGNAQTIPSLKAEGWDFHSRSEANLDLLVDAAGRGNADLVRGLMAQGVNVSGPAGCEALGNAAARRNITLAVDLLDAGAPVEAVATSGPESHPCLVLQSAATTGDPEMVKLILAHHPRVDALDSVGNTALMLTVKYAQSGAAFPAVARMLIAAGADVNMRDGGGKSALLRCFDSGVALVLLKAGAVDVNGRGNMGETPLMRLHYGDPATVQALLDAGADPRLKNNNGKTVLDILDKELEAGGGVITSTHDGIVQQDRSEADRMQANAALIRHWLADHPG